MSSTADLPDLTVWLALTWPEHIHHQQAIHDWEQQAAEHHLAALAIANGWRLVSFDRDFERFAGLERLSLA